MRLFLKKIKNLIAHKPGQRLVVQPAVAFKPPDLDFDDLKKNFKKRIYHFEHYQDVLLLKDLRLLHWIGSISYSGYTRESSLSYLIRNYVPGDENRILLRLNDWVPKIRRLAEGWVRQNFPELTLSQLDDDHELILYLSRKPVMRTNKTFGFINRCLVDKVEKAQPGLFYRLNAKFRRYLYALTLHKNPTMREWVLNDKDPANRALLLSAFKVDELSPQEMSRLYHDRAAFVRRRLLELQLQNNIIPSRETLIELCLDKNAALREFSRFYLSKYYHVDAYDLYKSRTDKARYYIADYARETDWEEFVKGIASTHSQVVFLCLTAICKVNYHYLLRLPISKLLAGSRKIRKLLCDYIPKVLTVEQIIALKSDLQTDQSKWISSYLSLLHRKSVWSFMDEAMSLISQGLSEQDLNFIFSKFNEKNYTYETLPHSMAARIKSKAKLLQESKDPKIAEFVRRVVFWVGTQRFT